MKLVVGTQEVDITPAQFEKLRGGKVTLASFLKDGGSVSIKPVNEIVTPKLWPSEDNTIILDDEGRLMLDKIFAKHVFDITPLPAPRMVASDKWAKRSVVLHYYDYCNALRDMCEKAGYVLSNPLNIIFIMPMPASFRQRKRKDMYLKPHKKRPDRDNLLKAFQDSFGKDDSHIWTGNTTKVWGEKGQIIIY